MQQSMCNPFSDKLDSVQKPLHLTSGVSDVMFHDSAKLPSDSDDEHSSSDEYNINLSSKESCQDFGLEYWIKHTNAQPKSPLPCNVSDQSVLLSTSHSSTHQNDISLSSSNKRKRSSSSKQSNHNSSKLRPIKIKFKDYDIPRLKIPKQVVRNYLRTLSPNNSSQSSSSSSSSCSSSYSLQSPYYQNETSTTRPKMKVNSSRRHRYKSSSYSIYKHDSSCLEKSFENLKNSIPTEIDSRISVTNNDKLHLTLKIDPNVYCSFRTRPDEQFLSSTLKTIDDYLSSNDSETELINSEQLLSGNNKSSFYSECNDDSLSFSCDIPYEDITTGSKCSRDDNLQRVLDNDSAHIQANKTQIVNNRKRSISDNEHQDNVVSIKRKVVQPSSVIDVIPKESDNSNKHGAELTPIDFLKSLIVRLKRYENIIYEKYCLSQPNAMKFLAQNHATNWESNKNILDQMHLVPCEFLNEIFHRALHCFGLEKKAVKETMEGNSSPINKCTQSESIEYKKIRDEYSFSLKRVRYGIGIIDELFRRKVSYQNIGSNNDDIAVVRKWKHIIYYVCLHAKSAFMAKEIQYYNYVQSGFSAVDGNLDLCSSSTPSRRSTSNIIQDMYSKSQLPKDGRLFSKLTPDHFSHSDLDLSPHSYDSGKGSSIRTSSNGPSLVSCCHTASSLNSTPHSSVHDYYYHHNQHHHAPLHSNLHLPLYQPFRIDEYQGTAAEYVRLLPEAALLHSKIVARIGGAEPNANSRDNMVKLIHYLDVVLTLAKDDRMDLCLRGLMTTDADASKTALSS